ncbi:MAG: hypothetical protein KJ893_01880 [Candidatus Omnitrophica bacterium]|nr:hypothetical protein [Candidatus Omnitrophota bacterium]
MKLFYSYSHKNEQYREDMERHLAILKRNGNLIDWSDKKIEVGLSRQSKLRGIF